MGKCLSHLNIEVILDVFRCAGYPPCALRPDSSCSVRSEADLDSRVPQPRAMLLPSAVGLSMCWLRWVAGRRERKAGAFISRVGPMRCVMLDQARAPADRRLH